MSDALYAALADSYEEVFEVLIESKTPWDDSMAAAIAAIAPEVKEEDVSRPTNTYNTLIGQLCGGSINCP